MAVVLLGAVLHAGWNAIVRASKDKFHDTYLIVIGAAAWALPLVPFLSLPAVESWPFLIASMIIHIAYFSLVALAYRGGELSFVYPVMRGCASAMSAIAAVIFLHESLTGGGWTGVALISCGIFALAGDSLRTGTFRTRPAAFALANAGVIVVYTLVDGQGARLSGSAISYTAWILLLTCAPMLAWSLATGRRAAFERLRLGWRRGLVGGGCTLASYALALWAMTRAPIALVAALRETSVVFGAIIAAAFLKEPVTRLRYASIFTVSAGAIAMKLF